MLRDPAPGLPERRRRVRSDPKAKKRYPRLRVGRTRLHRWRHGWDIDEGFVLMMFAAIAGLMGIVRAMRIFLW